MLYRYRNPIIIAIPYICMNQSSLCIPNPSLSPLPVDVVAPDAEADPRDGRHGKQRPVVHRALVIRRRQTQQRPA